MRINADKQSAKKNNSGKKPVFPNKTGAAVSVFSGQTTTCAKKVQHGRIAPSPPPPFPGIAPDNNQYDYEWQKPKTAIYVDKTPSVDLDEIAREAARKKEFQDFKAWVKCTLEPLPRFIQLRLTSRIYSIHSLKGPHTARLSLCDMTRRDFPRIKKVSDQYAITVNDEPTTQDDATFGELDHLYHNFETLRGLVGRFNHLPDFTPEDIELLAQDIASYIRFALSELHETTKPLSDRQYTGWVYTEAAKIAQVFRLLPPKVRPAHFLNDAVTGVYKMQDERYWHRNLKKYAMRWREHLHIAFGDVKRGAAPYCSKHHVDAWDARRKSSRAIMARLELEDQDTKERISLIEQIDKSISNPALRRVELMTRIGGFEKVATESGYSGQFFTLTAPSKYHAWTMSGHRNPKWNGASPRATQHYLNRIWQQIRAELARREIPIFGLRVAESHHDGTPHWHGLLFSRPEHASELLDVMQDYATREDAEELQGRHGNRPRFEMKPIDQEIGSATGYIVKYISKNIDGYALDGETDDETNRPLKETAKHATAWASCWGIRQFQFLGGAPVSVWRELRRFRNQEQADSINPLFAELHRAADAGDWQEYTQLQGGPLAPRRDRPLHTWYQPKEEANGYGEFRDVIKGLMMPAVAIAPIKTRLHNYTIVRKNPEVAGDAPPAVDLAVDLSVDLRAAPAAPRTRVNNCTEAKKCTIGVPHLLPDPPDNTDPEQLEIGQLTSSQKKKVADYLRNYKPAPPGSAADEFERLAYIWMGEGCSEHERERAEVYLKVAHRLREMEGIGPENADTNRADYAEILPESEASTLLIAEPSSDDIAAIKSSLRALFDGLILDYHDDFATALLRGSAVRIDDRREMVLRGRSEVDLRLTKQYCRRKASKDRLACNEEITIANPRLGDGCHHCATADELNKELNKESNKWL